MELREWLTTELGRDIWKKKYCQNGESLDQWFERVSGGDKELKRAIQEKKFLFGGRTLSNRGTMDRGSYFNCYSSGYCGDSLKEIMDLNTRLALTYKAQGGQGLSLSKIRPKGSGVGKNYESDGIIPFLELFNTTTASVSQGGSRKGALMVSLDIRHKEAENFITIKAGEDKISKANLSLEIDDEFMRAVEKYYESGEVITLHEVREYEGHEIRYDVVPIELFKLLCKTCYDWADPACLFTERFRNYNLMEKDDEYEIATSNPCVTKDTLIFTKEGYKPIIELIDKEVDIWNGYEFVSVTPRKTAENQKIMEVQFSNGMTLNCTPYHKFILKDGSRVECKDLKIGDKLIKCDFPIIDGDKELSHAYTQGFYSGDGFNGSDRPASYITFYGSKIGLDKYCDTISRREKTEKRETYSVKLDFKNKTFVPDASYSIKSRLDWLAGLIDSDGTSQNGSVQITSVDKPFLKDVFFMLQTLGVSTILSLNKKACLKTMKGKEYHCKDCYRLIISASNIEKLNSLGLETYRVDTNSKVNRSASQFITIRSIIETDRIEDVYCFNEPINHSGIFNGVITAQCGEQPLPKDFCCNLGSINLSEFVKNPFTEYAYFDYEDFAKTVGIGVRALDEIIDENADNHALKEQRENSLNYRNIGLGVFGYAGALMKLGMRYGSDEAKRFTDDLFNEMFLEAVWTSHNLAKEKGAFPKYKDCLFDSLIMKKHCGNIEIEALKKHGLRNCSLLSIAPTGTIATMLGESGGCEPEFALSYKRKTESLNDGEATYYDVFCKTVMEYANINKIENLLSSSLPSYFVSSSDIHWKDRVETQAIMQEHVDTAISSTVNLPKETSLEDVEKLYLYAWKMGLKGITIYRSGCNREGILVTEVSDKPKELARGEWSQKPEDTVYKLKKIYTGCGKMTLFVGYSPSEGKVVDFYIKRDGLGGCINNIETTVIGMSGMLRLGGSLENIKKAFSGIGMCPSFTNARKQGKKVSAGNTCGDAILKAVLEFGEELEGVEKVLPVAPVVKPKVATADKMVCPDCGETLSAVGHCFTCTHCGFSYCS